MLDSKKKIYQYILYSIENFNLIFYRTFFEAKNIVNLIGFFKKIQKRGIKIEVNCIYFIIHVLNRERDDEVRP